jgi:hypothetical protein
MSGDDAANLVLGLGGLLIAGFGLVLATNWRDVASRIGARRHGIGAFWVQYSAASWRLTGAVMMLIGALWIGLAVGGL